MKKTITFDDVLLTPGYSDIRSRSEIDLTQKIKKASAVTLPIVSSPMDTVTETDMIVSMSLAGGVGIVHRYNDINQQVEIVDTARKVLPSDANIGAAIGVSGDYIQRAEGLYDAGANILCVDIAHGHHILMKEALENLRSVFGHSVHLMAGNVATLDAFNDLSDWGADSIRVGVGGGSICSTRIMTGHGVPTLQSVMDCAKSDRDTILIADGGIKIEGDVVKALAAGADLVMLGSMLSGTDEAPGEFFYVDGEKCKSYRGMASAAAQMDWRGHVASEEGVSHRVISKGPVSEKLSAIEKAVRSGMSYTGAKNLSQLRAKSSFISISSASQVESATHILHR